MSAAEERLGVSVIIPAFNCAAYVADAVESALNQTRPPAEVIVVDDGSTDGTDVVLRGFGSRIRVVSQQNRGLPAARNAGVAVATGEWLAFLDADDLWLPEKLARQGAATADPRVALVYTDRFNIGDRGAHPEVQGQALDLYEGDVFLPLLTSGNSVTASSAMVRASVFQSLGGFMEHLRSAEDWDLWIRIAEHHRVAVCREPLVCYRYHGSMMSGNPRRMCEARRQVMERALALPRGQALPPAVKRQVRAFIARSNAVDASCRGAIGLALSEYLTAATTTPADFGVYVDFLRFVLRRHSA